MKRDTRAKSNRTFPLAAGAFLTGMMLAACLTGCAVGEAGSMAHDGGGSDGPAINKLSAGNSTDMSTAGLQDASSSGIDAANSDIQAVTVEHQELHETVQVHTVKSPRLAQQIYEAYLQGEVGEVTDMWAADYDDNLIFTMSDGSIVSAVFNAHNLVDGDVVREFNDKGGLWKLLEQMDD